MWGRNDAPERQASSPTSHRHSLYWEIAMNPVKSFVVTGVLMAALLGSPAHPHPCAKALSLHSGPARPIDFVITASPNIPPTAAARISPGQIRLLFVVPEREHLWYRFQGEQDWTRRIAV